MKSSLPGRSRLDFTTLTATTLSRNQKVDRSSRTLYCTCKHFLPKSYKKKSMLQYVRVE